MSLHILRYDVCFQGFRSSPSSNLPVGIQAVVRQVEAKYPALLFKQQLTAYVEKIYGIIRDNLKKDVTTLLAQCIQVQLVLFLKHFIFLQLASLVALKPLSITFLLGFIDNHAI